MGAQWKLRYEADSETSSAHMAWFRFLALQARRAYNARELFTDGLEV